MGSGRTNLLLRHDKIREGRQEEPGWEDHTNTHINTHTHEDDGSDWKGFPLGFLPSSFSCFLSLIFCRSL